MPLITLQGFRGVIPKLGNRLLPDQSGQVASNVKLQSGELRPMQQPRRAHTPATPKTGTQTSIFRARNGLTSAEWFTWPGIDVDCVQVPLSSDVESRFCWTGDGVPKTASYTEAVSGGGSNYPLLANELTLGIPTPVTAPTVTPSGGTGADVTRFYRYTFYSQDNEESSPSPISAIAAGKPDATWAIAAMDTAPLNNGVVSSTTRSGSTITAVTSARNWLRVGDKITVAGVATMTEANGTFTVTAVASNGLSFSYAVTAAATGTPGGAGTWARVTPWNTANMVKRLYRTTGNSGSWQLVNETGIAVATTTYNDTLTDAQIAGDELISEGWIPPPTNLHSLCVHPSGALLGISGNRLCASEPYQPHAWPEAYQLASAYTGVGLALFGSTAVMATNGMPFVATGVEPASMSGEDVQGAYPALSKRSVFSIGTAVGYASLHGLVTVGTQGVGLYTAPWLSKDEWSALNPETMICAESGGRVYIAYTDDDGNKLMLVFDGDQLTTVTVSVDELYADPGSGDLYVVQGGDIMLWDDPDSPVLAGNWRSKEFVFPAPVNLGAAKIDFDTAVDPVLYNAYLTERAAVLAANTTLVTSGDVDGEVNSRGINAGGLNGSSIATLPSAPASNSVTFNLWQGDTLKCSRVVSTTKAFRLPAGYKADAYSFEVFSQCRIKQIRVAETMEQLKQQ